MRALAFSVCMLLLVGCMAEPPTPGSLPVEGVERLTGDFAFYRDLIWSPSGEWIATTRCPIQQAQPNCLGNEEAVLVNPDAGGAEPIDFGPLSPNFVSSYPVDWSEDGDRVLLYVEISPSAEAAPLSQRESMYVAYSPGAKTFDDIYADPATVLAWDSAGESLLLTDASGAQLLVGWYDYSAGRFVEAFVYSEPAKLDGPHALSPDQRVLLRGDSSLPTTCLEIDRADLLGQSGFEPFLSMACYPAWSANGLKIVYALKDDPQGEPNRLMVANADGSSPAPIFGEQTVAFLAFPTWSPDGSRIAFTVPGTQNANAVYVAAVPPGLRP